MHGYEYQGSAFPFRSTDALLKLLKKCPDLKLNITGVKIAVNTDLTGFEIQEGRYSFMGLKAV